MSSGMVPLIDRHLEVEHVDPLGAFRSTEPPGVALVLDVAQHEAGLGRELGLHQHLVAPHVDDGVDVLDVHRALLDARPTGGARPQDIGIDDRRDQVLHLDAGRPVLRHHPVGRGEEVVAQVHDQQLGREGFAGVPGRALGLAPAALGAGGHVEELLPREVLDAAGAEHHLVVLAHVLHRHVRGGGQGPEGPGPA